LRGARKYVIGVSSLDREIIRLNLEDQGNLDISGLSEFRTGVTSELESKQQK
jgi:hypothetical protein